MTEPACPVCHAPMRTTGEQIRFDHEPGDSPRDTETLNHLAAMGVQLGATVTMYGCGRCGTVEGLFIDD